MALKGQTLWGHRPGRINWPLPHEVPWRIESFDTLNHLILLRPVRWCCGICGLPRPPRPVLIKPQIWLGRLFLCTVLPEIIFTFSSFADPLWSYRVGWQTGSQELERSSHVCSLHLKLHNRSEGPSKHPIRISLLATNRLQVSNSKGNQDMIAYPKRSKFKRFFSVRLQHCCQRPAASPGRALWCERSCRLGHSVRVR